MAFHRANRRRAFLRRFDSADYVSSWIEVSAQDLVHGEHVHLGRVENGLKIIITDDVAAIGGILEAVIFNVFPDMLHRLGARELSSVSSHRTKI